MASVLFKNGLIVWRRLISDTTYHVPVCCTDGRPFYTTEREIDLYHPSEINGRIVEQIEQCLQDEGYGLPPDFELEFSEVIYNAYDAFSRKALVLNDELIIQVKVFLTQTDIVIEVKDNGGGFKNKPKAVAFTVDKLPHENKQMGMYNGGSGHGLMDFRNMLFENGGQLFFANRRSASPEGAMVDIHLPYPNEQQEKAPPMDLDDISEPEDSNASEELFAKLPTI
jgi:hypothetical protein